MREGREREREDRTPLSCFFNKSSRLSRATERKQRRAIEKIEFFWGLSFLLDSLRSRRAATSSGSILAVRVPEFDSCPDLRHLPDRFQESEHKFVCSEKRGGISSAIRWR